MPLNAARPAGPKLHMWFPWPIIAVRLQGINFHAKTGLAPPGIGGARPEKIGIHLWAGMRVALSRLQLDMTGGKQLFHCDKEVPLVVELVHNLEGRVH